MMKLSAEVVAGFNVRRGYVCALPGYKMLEVVNLLHAFHQRRFTPIQSFPAVWK